MKLRLITFLTISISVIGLCHAQTVTIDLDKNTSSFTNISEIASEVKPITFQVDKEHSFGSVRALIFLKNSIVLAVHENFKGELISKVLQFDQEGKFIRQIGEKRKGFISLSYDPDRKEIGVGDQKTIDFFNESGTFNRSIEATQFHQSYFDCNYWLVEMEAKKGENYEYDLVKFDPLDKNREKVLSYKNPPDMMVVGIFPTYSLVNETLFLSTNLKGLVYSIEGGQANLAFQLKSKKEVRGITTLLKDWITTSTLDPRRSGRILHFYNLQENKNYTAMSSYVAGNPGSTITNNFLDNGLIRPFEGTILGYPNQNALCFTSVSASNSETSHTIYIAILK